MPVDVARQVNDREAPLMFGEVDAVFEVEERSIPGAGGNIRLRIYRPHAGSAMPVLVYFHGGGWVVGSLDSHDGVARHLCAHGGCLVVSVDYRLGPEHRFPAALDDAWTALTFVHRHASELGGDASRLAVGGDSAGGNLAAVVAIRARAAGIPLRLQLLVYPVLDFAGPAADAGSDAFGWWMRNYLRTKADALNPDASPLRAVDLHGLAPALLLSCGLDVLQHEAREYERRLREAGNPVVHIVYPDLIHAAYRMPAVLDGARKMLEDSAAALTAAMEVT